MAESIAGRGRTQLRDAPPRFLSEQRRETADAVIPRALPGGSATRRPSADFPGATASSSAGTGAGAVGTGASLRRPSRLQLTGAGAPPGSHPGEALSTHHTLPPLSPGGSASGRTLVRRTVSGSSGSRGPVAGTLSVGPAAARLEPSGGSAGGGTPPETQPRSRIVPAVAGGTGASASSRTGVGGSGGSGLSHPPGGGTERRRAQAGLAERSRLHGGAAAGGGLGVTSSTARLSGGGVTASRPSPRLARGSTLAAGGAAGRRVAGPVAGPGSAAARAAEARAIVASEAAVAAAASDDDDGGYSGAGRSRSGGQDDGLYDNVIHRSHRAGNSGAAPNRYGGEDDGLYDNVINRSHHAGYSDASHNRSGGEDDADLYDNVISRGPRADHGNGSGTGAGSGGGGGVIGSATEYSVGRLGFHSAGGASTAAAAAIPGRGSLLNPSDLDGFRAASSSSLPIHPPGSSGAVAPTVRSPRAAAAYTNATAAAPAAGGSPSSYSAPRPPSASRTDSLTHPQPQPPAGDPLQLGVGPLSIFGPLASAAPPLHSTTGRSTSESATRPTHGSGTSDSGAAGSGAVLMGGIAAAAGTDGTLPGTAAFSAFAAHLDMLGARDASPASNGSTGSGGGAAAAARRRSSNGPMETANRNGAAGSSNLRGAVRPRDDGHGLEVGTGGGLGVRGFARGGGGGGAAAAGAPSRATGTTNSTRLMFDFHHAFSSDDDSSYRGDEYDSDSAGEPGGAVRHGAGVRLPQRLFRVQLNPQAAEGTTFGPTRPTGPNRPPLPPGHQTHSPPPPLQTQSQQQSRLRQRTSETDDDGVVGGALAIGGGGGGGGFQERFLADLRRRDAQRAALVHLLSLAGEEELLRQAEEEQLALALMLSLQEATGGGGSGGGGGGGASGGGGGGGAAGAGAALRAGIAIGPRTVTVRLTHGSMVGVVGAPTEPALTYEELLNLEDVKVTVPQHVLNSLPDFHYKGPGSAPDGTCAICQCDYELGDQLVRLPCMHVLHAGCAKRWLGEYSKKCPICKAEVC